MLPIRFGEEHKHNLQVGRYILDALPKKNGRSKLRLAMTSPLNTRRDVNHVINTAVASGCPLKTRRRAVLGHITTCSSMARTHQSRGSNRSRFKSFISKYGGWGSYWAVGSKERPHFFNGTSFGRLYQQHLKKKKKKTHFLERPVT